MRFNLLQVEKLKNSTRGGAEDVYGVAFSGPTIDHDGGR
jgi:hypothetical protein